MELMADWGQAVLDTRRHLGINRAAHDAFALEILELRGKRSMRDIYGTLEFIEALRSLAEFMQHENGPFSLQDLLRCHERADTKQFRIDLFH